MNNQKNQTIQSRTTDMYTLQEVNSALLQELHQKIKEAETTKELVELSGAIAKLNIASKNSDYFAKPVTEEDLINDAQLDALSAIEGVEV